MFFERYKKEWSGLNIFKGKGSAKGTLIPLLPAIFIISCSPGLNSVVNESNRDVTINLNVKNISGNDPETVKIDGKNISAKDYGKKENKLKFSGISLGRHVFEFQLKDLGKIEVPVEVKAGINNNFQYNPQVTDGKITAWEVGLDADEDGLADNGGYFTRDFQSYVVVRDSSGNLSYLPKNNLEEDFRNSVNAKPADFKFPELKENEFNPAAGKQVASGKNSFTGSTDLFGADDPFGVPFPENVIITLPENISNYKLDLAVSGQLYLNWFYVHKEGRYFIIHRRGLGNFKEFKIYLSDNEHFVMAELKFKNLEKYYSGDKVAPVGDLSGSFTPLAVGKPVVTMVDANDINLTVNEGIKITPEEKKNLTFYKDAHLTPPVPVPVARIKTRQVAVPVIDKKSGKKFYAVFQDSGNLQGYLPEENFHPDENTVILPAKETPEEKQGK